MLLSNFERRTISESILQLAVSCDVTRVDKVGLGVWGCSLRNIVEVKPFTLAWSAYPKYRACQ